MHVSEYARSVYALTWDLPAPLLRLQRLFSSRP